MVKTGCDILARERCDRLKGRVTGVLANQASVSSDLRHITDIILSNNIELKAIFGPQHGYTGETQANMIEWESYTHPGFEIPVYSLYGETRTPTDTMLKGLDCVVIDLCDVGTRCYTYIWTAALMLRACAEAGIETVVVDRPNPLGGKSVEGPVIKKGFESFVGLFPLAIRHGLTISEALKMINESENKKCALDIVKMRGWKRSMLYTDTSLPWVMPSPNMPSPKTALLYPGMVFLEGTNISEGRGTTHPFEIIGAPWINSEKLAGELSRKKLEGTVFRPSRFKPTWDKYSGSICEGVQIHVTDKNRFKPVRTAAIIIQVISRLYPKDFRWGKPPYEYENDKMPIDIITGGRDFRNTINNQSSIEKLFESWMEEEIKFEKERRKYFLY